MVVGYSWEDYIYSLPMRYSVLPPIRNRQSYHGIHLLTYPPVTVSSLFRIITNTMYVFVGTVKLSCGIGHSIEHVHDLPRFGYIKVFGLSQLSVHRFYPIFNNTLLCYATHSLSLVLMKSFCAAPV